MTFFFNLIPETNINLPISRNIKPRNTSYDSYLHRINKTSPGLKYLTDDDISEVIKCSTSGDPNKTYQNLPSPSPSRNNSRVYYLFPTISLLVPCKKQY